MKECIKGRKSDPKKERCRNREERKKERKKERNVYIEINERVYKKKRR